MSQVERMVDYAKSSDPNTVMRVSIKNFRRIPRRHFRNVHARNLVTETTRHVVNTEPIVHQASIPVPPAPEGDSVDALFDFLGNSQDTRDMFQALHGDNSLELID